MAEHGRLVLTIKKRLAIGFQRGYRRLVITVIKNEQLPPKENGFGPTIWKIVTYWFPLRVWEIGRKWANSFPKRCAWLEVNFHKR